ncbi:MAG TPA: small basic family protein [Candidatus Avacidaminococcus intestinavium]|uniref:Small basic family protein n=1 Tax=Candidatus Avacidaminococcus intestinavium TaxID=2840684 RepID=A0A9D1SKH2_9FIRM|nr:small basic family protein [Candidatus Avacidaminococcus intestinavium]
MIYPLIGLVIGLIIGFEMPISLPQEYVKLLSVALLAVFDSVLGGVRAAKEGHYDNQIFISGFFINALLATLLCYGGEIIGIDLYFVGILVFGMRIFQNIAIIRRLYLGK